MSDWSDLDPTAVPLPHGTLVTTRRAHDGRPQGAVGRVVGVDEAGVTLRFADGHSLTLPRADVVPTKLGEARYAVRRAEAWAALRPTAIVDTVVGSRAWGLSEEGSDVDRRGVFVLPTPWTAGLVTPPTELVSLDGSGTYWELGKAVRQALRADPNTLETLFLPGARALDPMGEQLLA
ncbi:MAG: nucleotidyltransferase domain-containing protein, partial [Myxococcota bacterium]